MGCGILILLLICYVSKPFNVIALKCHFCHVESAYMCEPSSVQTCIPAFKYCATFSTIDGRNGKLIKYGGRGCSEDRLHQGTKCRKIYFAGMFSESRCLCDTDMCNNISDVPL